MFLFAQLKKTTKTEFLPDIKISHNVFCERFFCLKALFRAFFVTLHFRKLINEKVLSIKI